MTAVDWRELVTRDEDPEHLAGTEIEPAYEWGVDYETFLESLAREHPMAWLLDQPDLNPGASS